MDKEELQQVIDLAVEKQMEKLMQIDRKFVPGEPKDEDVDKGKFKTFGDFLYNVKNNPGDARLKAGLSEGLDSAGGFLVPEEFRNTILMTAIENAVIRPNGATVIPMRSDTLNISKVLDVAHSAALGIHGGVIAHWTEEVGEKDVEEPTFGRVKLIAKKLTGYTYASDELLADSAVGLEALLVRMFGEAIAWYEDEAFIDGSGVGEPLGIMNSGALVTVARSAASAVALADLAGMWARLLPASHGRAVWLANPDVLSRLAQLASTTLTWLQMNQGVAKTMPGTIFGRPIYFTEKCQTLNTVGDIMLVDLSYYLIGDRQKLTVASSSHVRFLTDETAWRFVQRVDGQPWVEDYFTPKHGATLSPFVVLAAGS